MHELLRGIGSFTKLADGRGGCVQRIVCDSRACGFEKLCGRCFSELNLLVIDLLDM